MTRHTLTILVDPAEDLGVPVTSDEIVQQLEASDLNGLDIVVEGLDGISL